MSARPESLSTARLRLRLACPADRDDLHRLEQDPDVMRHLNGGAPTPLVPVDPEASPYRMPRGEDDDVWLVIVRENGALAGWVAMHIDGDTGELGYRFFKNDWGHGYASEAAQVLVAETFARSSVERIIARTMIANARSRRVMERLGMRPHASAGAEPDEIEYVITRHAWRP